MIYGKGLFVATMYQRKNTYTFLVICDTTERRHHHEFVALRPTASVDDRVSGENRHVRWLDLIEYKSYVVFCNLA